MDSQPDTNTTTAVNQQQQQQESTLSKTIKSARSRSITSIESTLSTSLGKVPNDFDTPAAGVDQGPGNQGKRKEKQQQQQSKKPNPGVAAQPEKAKKPTSSNTQQQQQQQQPQSNSTLKKQPQERQNNLFSNLQPFEQKTTESLMRRTKESDTIYPAVMATAIEMARDNSKQGGTERCVAMMRCFRQVIMDNYKASADQAISRHLDAFLRPQINYLVNARPLSVSMSHAIRHLKMIISQLPVDIDEDEAKDVVCRGIDQFLRNRIDLAGQLIVTSALGKIREDNEVILIYGPQPSTLVAKLLIEAANMNKRFKVILVIGQTPLTREDNLIRTLADRGIDCTIVPLTSIGYVLPTVTKVILGAQCIFSNGSLLSWVGSAVVGLMAKEHNVPVVVLAETLKFTERVQLDAFVYNELADFENNDIHHIQQENLKAFKLVYDVMPAEYVTMVVSEVGMIPVTSVPVVLREHPY